MRRKHMNNGKFRSENDNASKHGCTHHSAMDFKMDTKAERKMRRFEMAEVLGEADEALKDMHRPKAKPKVSQEVEHMLFRLCFPLAFSSTQLWMLNRVA